MSKYWTVFKMSFKQEKDTIFDTFTRCIMYFLLCYILIQLWGYIYGGGKQAIINSYTLEQMLWYLIVGECIVNSAKCNQITRSISNEIKSGSIAYKLNKPYNYYVYSVVSFMAKTCFITLFTLPTAIIIGAIFIGLPPNFTLVQIVPCLFTFFLSIFISWCIYGVVGLIAFWVQDSTPFYWIVSKAFLLLGMFFPLEFFPLWLQPLIRYSPIYSVMTGPSSLVASFSWEAFKDNIISQSIWCTLIILLGICIFNFGRKKVTSNGG